MEYSIFDHMEECSEVEVERLLGLASPQRAEQALKYKHIFGQFACLKSYQMLLSMLRKNQMIGPDERPVFDIATHGKPRFSHLPDIHFNISHCKNAILVAIDQRPIGIDVERIVTPKESLVEYTMTSEEANSIHEAPYPEIRFTELWTQKEALLKLRGTGIQGGLKDALLDVQGATLLTRHNITQQYIYTIASQK